MKPDPLFPPDGGVSGQFNPTYTGGQYADPNTGIAYWFANVDYTDPGAAIPEPPDDPCDRLAWAATVQRVAQYVVGEAAKSGKTLVDKVYGTVNDMMSAQIGAIKYFEKKLASTGRKLQTSATKAKQKLLDKLNAAAVSLSRDMHIAASQLQAKLDVNLNAPGASIPPVAFPSYNPLRAGQLNVFAGPEAIGAFRPPAQPESYDTEATNGPLPAQASPPGAVPLSAGVAATLPATRAGALPPPPAPATGAVQSRLPLQPGLSLPTEANHAVATALASAAADVSAEAWALPLAQVSLADFVTALCHCLTASARAGRDPVDLNEPLVYRFAEGQERWHAAALQYYGDGLQDYIQAPTLADMIAARESREKDYQG